VDQAAARASTGDRDRGTTEGQRRRGRDGPGKHAGALCGRGPPPL